MLPPGRARVAATPLVTGSVFEIDCDNRNGARGRSSRVQYQRAARHDHARILRNDFRYQRGNSRRVTFRGSRHNLDLGGSGIAGIPQAAQDPLEPIGHRRLRALIYKTDSGDFRLLLSTRRERPNSHRTTKQADELASPHTCPPRLKKEPSYRQMLACWKGAARCPLWVISGHMQCNKRCPLYTQ